MEIRPLPPFTRWGHVKGEAPGFCGAWVWAGLGNELLPGVFLCLKGERGHGIRVHSIIYISLFISIVFILFL
jgi:hypothetical protein